MGTKTILLTGGSGTLGTAIRKLVDCVAPSARELDVTNSAACRRAIKKYNPDVVIHAAAWTDVAGAEKNKEKCWAVNVTGTQNILRASHPERSRGMRRVIYISTDYVFDGEQGNYREDDVPNPVNFYALTKLAGELIIKQYPNTLIIRTAFKKDGVWPSGRAFYDQWVSHEFVSALAPEIVKAALMRDLVGMIHIAGKRKRMYDLARRAMPDVKKVFLRNAAVPIPRDVSLNSSKWKKVSSPSNRAKRS